MGSFSIWHWLIVLLVILLLFGGGAKLSGLMGDVAKGIKSFKKNMKDGEDDASMADDQPQRPAGNLSGPAHHPQPSTEPKTSNSSHPAA
ncbi:twin-arginine translocase TatA/TatE family subunit [Pseudoroseomonas globiformis]|uniref:Sec-independent protein translocase protein TatA n=1 Tax=Teichococcus globiformis TaxID=2307229 RepID=A0ABV7FU27_9PROT